MLKTRAMKLTTQELSKATHQYPAFHSPHEGIAVLHEEFIELRSMVYWSPRTEHNQQERTDALRVEALHVAAMALRFLIDCC